MDIQQKMEIIRTSTWPAALHSAEGSRRAANAAMVDDHNLSSHHVGMCDIEDPLLFTVLQMTPPKNSKQLGVWQPHVFCG